MPWARLLEAACGLGWTPTEFWAATLYELETAVWVATRQPEAPAMSEDESRAFFSRLQPKDAD